MKIRKLTALTLSSLLSLSSLSVFAANPQQTDLSINQESISSEIGLLYMKGVKTIAPEIADKISLLNDQQKQTSGVDFTISQVKELFESGMFK